MLVALAAHGAFFGVARTLPAMNLLFERGGQEEAGLLWIETEAEGITREPELERAAPSKPESDPPASDDRQVAAATRDDAARPTATKQEAPARESADETPSSDAASGESSASSERAPSDARTAEGGTATAPSNDGFSPLEAGPAPGSGFIPGGPLGLAGQIAIAGSEGTAAPTSAPAAKQADAGTVNKLLGSTLLGQTREKGIDLPATQVVVGAVSAQTRTLSVPHNTRASFTVKLGPGGGLVVDRKVIEGASGIGGEWGHTPLPWARPDEVQPRDWCGRVGCLEQWLSGSGFKRWAGMSASEANEKALAGDPQARVLLDMLADRAARALAVIIDIVDPDAIVFGGGVSNVDSLYPSIRGKLLAHVFSDYIAVKIVKNKHGDSSGVRGAAWLFDADGEASENMA